MKVKNKVIIIKNLLCQHISIYIVFIILSNVYYLVLFIIYYLDYLKKLSILEKWIFSSENTFMLMYFYYCLSFGYENDLYIIIELNIYVLEIKYNKKFIIDKILPLFIFYHIDLLIT